MNSLTYITKRCSDLDDKTLKQCSDLFSNHYGVYNGKDDIHSEGQRIRLGVKYYMNIRNTENMHVSLCYSGPELIGQAFFLKKEVAKQKTCTWVTQLLVNKYYRSKGIATRLLHSAWGFSDYFAWGLATANALTIKALESVTWRRVEPTVIVENLDTISKMCDDIPFAKEKQMEVSERISQIFTNFYPEQEKTNSTIGKVYVEKLGTLKNGYEWLAFTFQSQPMMLDEKHLNMLLDFSTTQLEDAYGRMDMQNQTWTNSTPHEIDYVLAATGIKKGDKVLDLGSGIGRHTIELAKHGMNVTAVEPSTRLMDAAINNAFAELSLSQVDAITFRPIDGRKKQLIEGKFDAVICLYDVIGSYRNKKDNISLLETIAAKLKKGGRAVISIMNMELTEHVAKHKVDIHQEPQQLLRLKPSNIMQRTGNIFNPDYFVLDPKEHLVYRKEQFDNDGLLSTEYVIADYRFKRDEFMDECERCNLTVISANYVKLGNWDTPLNATDKAAKEILVVVEKK